LQAQVEHPLRLALLGRDVADDVLVETAGRRGPGVVAVGPAELVAADTAQLWVALFDGGHRVSSLLERSPLVEPVETMALGVVGACGMQVVQTPAPWAMVASRWT